MAQSVVANAGVSVGANLQGVPRLSIASVTGLGTVIGNAAQIPMAGFVTLLAANAAVGCQLPTPVGGEMIILKNDDTANAVMLVWPNTGGTINAIAANTNFNMAAKTSAIFIAKNTTAWITVPLLPS